MGKEEFLNKTGIPLKSRSDDSDLNEVLDEDDDIAEDIVD
jgi:hypothetical protein